LGSLVRAKWHLEGGRLVHHPPKGGVIQVASGVDFWDASRVHHVLYKGNGIFERQGWKDAAVGNMPQRCQSSPPQSTIRKKLAYRLLQHAWHTEFQGSVIPAELPAVPSPGCPWASCLRPWPWRDQIRWQADMIQLQGHAGA
jgi:hypothetical protein